MLSSINMSKVGATGPTLSLLVPILEPITFTGSGSVGPSTPTGPTAPTGPSTVLSTPFVERIEFTGSGPCGPTGPTVPEHPINLIHPLVSQVTAPTENTGGGSTDVYENYAVVDGAQTILLDRPQLYAGQKLYVNGLLQRRNSYLLNNNVLTLPSELEILTGDSITFEYN